jgi:tRNA(Phe) wybutosine-synthesizing methylase Tyw3
MDVPLAKQDYQFLLEEYLVFLTKTGNDLLRRGQEKLTRLQKNLEKMKQK